ERACAMAIIESVGRKAFRRPLTADDTETMMRMFAVGRDEGSFEAGIRTVVQSLLARPEFIFRFERVPDGTRTGESYKINDLELASRLSYFLWGSLPDELLLEAASQGRLRTPAVLDAQVKRMLADRRAESLSTSFAAQWLRLTGL